jgi:PAS domain S-box-containing protein
VRAKVDVFVELHRRALHIRQQDLLLREAERRRSEEELRASESQYQATFNQAAIGIAQLSPTGEHWLLANRHLCEMLGYGEAELGERTWADLCDPETVENDRQVFRRLLSGSEGSVRHETRLCSRQGTRLWVELNIALLRDGRGAPRMFVVVIEDFTRRRRAEEARAFLVEATAVLLASLEARRSLTRLGELAVRSVADLALIEVFADEPGLVVAGRSEGDRAGLEELWRRRPSGQRPVPERPTLLVETPAGSLVPLVASEAAGPLAERLAGGSLIWVPIKGRDRLTVGTLLLARIGSARRFDAADLAMAEDLTDRVALALDNARLYAQARAAIAARDEFMSIASHELRTPLTPLLLQMENLIKAVGKTGPSPERLDTGLRRMQRQVHKLQSLMDRLLDVTHASTGRLQLRPQTVDLSRLVGEVCRRFAEEAARNGCALNLTLPDAFEGQWDGLRLEQVMTNLLANALKYGRGQPIDVLVDPGPDRARIVVKDRGIGIPPTALGRIFERFERAVSADSYGGLGLGLYITRQIVEAHGGSIRAESTMGSGATFTVELPRTTAVPAAGDHP